MNGNSLKYYIFTSFVIFLIIINIFYNKLLDDYFEESKWVEHTHKVILESTNYLSAMQDAETGQRGFILTSNIEYLEPYNQGIINSQIHFNNLLKLTSDNQLQQEKLKLIKKQMNLKFEELALTISLLNNNNNNNKALEIVKNNSGKQYMDNIRSIIKEFTDEEQRLLKVRKQSLKDSIQFYQYSLQALIVIFLIITFNYIYLILKHKKTIQDINIELHNKVNEQVEQIRQNEIHILEQSKMASMGEMIGNIAHQWRQPLSIISTFTSSLRIEKELNTLTDEEFEKCCTHIDKNIQYLSATIDTFSDFIKEEKIFTEVILQDRIKIALSIIAGVLKKNHIELKDNIDYEKPLKVKLVTGELAEVIINIIHNAKDILIERKIDKAWISLDIEEKDNTAIISIEDNAGGIPEDILQRIFEPYFTTKHKSIGTGLGLHMSYKIVTESLKGKLYVKNTDNGAKFFIELPLSKLIES